MTKRGLGKGLDALFADNSAEIEKSGVVTLKLTEIEPNKGQPRKNFDEEALIQLADSIQNHGILQPLLVRPINSGEGYQLVAGERRYRASKMAGLSEVPVVIKEMNDEEVVAVALIENLQREDLNPIEEATGYKKLLDTYNLTQDEISKRVGKSRPVIANALRILSLPEPVVQMVKDNKISAGHARTLLALEDKNSIIELANEIIKKGMSVREVEKAVKKKLSPNVEEQKETLPNVIASEIELSLTEKFGRKVTIIPGKKKGVLQIEYYGEDDLKELSNTLYNK